MKKLLNLLNSRKLFITLLVIVLLYQLFVPLYMIYGREIIIIKGTEISLPVMPFDPYDYFRGNYLRFNVNQETVEYNNLSAEVKKALLNKTNNNKNINYDESIKCYVTFKSEIKGYSTFDKIYATRPSDTDAYLSAVLQRTTTDFADNLGKKQYNIIYPVNQFYINEKYGKPAEEAIRNLNSDNKVYVKVKILNGDYVVTDININDKSIYQYIDQNSKI